MFATWNWFCFGLFESGFYWLSWNTQFSDLCLLSARISDVHLYIHFAVWNSWVDSLSRKKKLASFPWFKRVCVTWCVPISPT